VKVESSQRGLQLWFRPRPDRRSTQEVIALQTRGSFNFGKWESRDKSYLNEGLAQRCKVYYMGEGGGFPQVRDVVSLGSLRSPVARPSTKGVPTMY
jgi:hypothetical protein